MKNRMFGTRKFIFLQIVMNAIVVDCFVRWRVGHGALKLTAADIRDIKGKYDVAIVNFYHKDCPHSKMFIGIYDEAADILRQEFPEENAVLIGKADCSEERHLIEEEDIIKFPTVRLFRSHTNTMHEYRGPRTVDGLLEFVRNEMKDPIVKVKALEDLNHLNWRKRNLIGYFENDSSNQYAAFAKLAKVIRDGCDVYAVVGSVSAPERRSGDKIVYRAIGNASDFSYPGSLDNYDHMLRWAIIDKCFTQVIEMTFDRAEEAAEFRVPLLILFHHPDETETKTVFQQQVKWQLYDQTTRMMAATADGLVFKTPLQRLGKTEHDLPLLVIDTYQHMYVWPFDPTKDLSKPGLLKQFVDDLHSGKLHEMYHEQHPDERRETITFDFKGNPIPRGQPRTSPILSEFVKLAPSSSRFTFVQREEL